MVEDNFSENNVILCMYLCMYVYTYAYIQSIKFVYNMEKSFIDGKIR